MITANLSFAQVQKQLPLVQSGRDRWLISINNPGDLPQIHAGNDFKEILTLEFDDVERLDQQHWHQNRMLKRMSGSDLSLLVEFIKKAQTAKVDLYVHCAAGICRSGAVVEVLVMLGWQVDDEVIAGERHPNRFVFNHLRRAFGYEFSFEKE